MLHADTTDRLILFGSNGRFYTVSVAAIPGGRGLGDPVRVMVDLPNEADIVSLLVHREDRRLVLASAAGFGFVVREAEVAASTRNGKQVMNVRPPDHARACDIVNGDHLAVAGSNGRLLVYPVEELPELARGKGVRLQKYSRGELSGIRTFALSSGLQWKDPAGRTRTERELDQWIGKRGSTGRRPPRGFPKDNRFT